MPALDSAETDKALRHYASCILQPDMWSFLPPMYRLHKIAMAAFRAVSKSACALYALDKVRCRMYPAKNFCILRSDPEAQVEAAKSILRDFQERPGCMDAWGYARASKYSMVGALLSPESLSRLTLDAAMSELESSSTAAGNAAVRRRVKQHLQQKLPL